MGALYPRRSAAFVPTGRRTLLGAPRLASGPCFDSEAPQADEALGVLVLESIARLVGGQVVVVEADVAAPAGHDAPTRKLAPQSHLAGHEALTLLHERIEGLLQRAEPQ